MKMSYRYVFMAALGAILMACAVKRPQPSPLPVPPGLVDAPIGFDTSTNGFASQADMDDDRDQFTEEAILPALGPAYNARACSNCHDTPNIGAGSQVTEHRIAPDDKDDSIAPATLVHDRSTVPELQQRAPVDAINTLRSSLSLMGDGFVEAVPDSELIAIAAANGGQYVTVTRLEDGKPCIGRFGWKDQHCSLLSFAGDADFNEKGVGNRLLKDPANGIEDGDNPKPGKPEDIDFYAEFMRSLKAPPRGSIGVQEKRGEAIFGQIGCAVCHVQTLYTERYVFHPFGDYLLHDIKTGDGIQQGPAPANKVRTAPLWGLRARSRFLHDLSAYDIPTAIVRHKGEAKGAASLAKRLSVSDKQALLSFLNSL